MKKIFLFIVLAAIFLWANAHKNELAVWFDSDNFYHPLFESDFDVYRAGSSIHAVLKPSYDVRHGFFLTFPCDGKISDRYNNLDGAIRYSLHSQGIELESKTIAVPSYPMRGLSSGGICDIVLFTFDIPFQGHDEVTLDVVVESPIMKLAPHQNIRCKVSPAYWPK